MSRAILCFAVLCLLMLVALAACDIPRNWQAAPPAQGAPYYTLAMADPEGRFVIMRFLMARDCRIEGEHVQRMMRRAGSTITFDYEKHCVLQT